MRPLWIPALLCATLMFAMSQPAMAQVSPAQSSVSGAIGMVSFDVDGVATTVGVTGRASAAVTSRLAVEGNVSWARNKETGTSDMWVVEAHVHYFWHAAHRVRPYAGGGAGLFINKGDFLTDRSLTLSGAGGVRVDLTTRVSALGEFRIRGVEFDFAGSVIEVWTGLTFRLGR